MKYRDPFVWSKSTQWIVLTLIAVIIYHFLGWWGIAALIVLILVFIHLMLNDGDDDKK